MGGYGSGRHGWRRPKGTVEGCLILSADKLTRDKILQEGSDAADGVTRVYNARGETVSAISYEVDTRSRAAPWIRLHYALGRSGQHVDCRVDLTTTPLPWGGVRWWFLCPLFAGACACGRRVGKLYLPPRETHFACRHCYDLTYTSCRESHKFDGLSRLLAADLDMDPKTVRRLLSL